MARSVQGVYGHRPDDLIGDPLDPSQRVDEKIGAQALPLLRQVYRYTLEVHDGRGNAAGACATLPGMSSRRALPPHIV